MRKPFASLMTALVLLSTVVVPPLGLAFGAANFALGLLLVVGLYAFLFAALCAIHEPRQNLGKLALIVIVILTVVLAQGMFSFLVNTTFNISRFFQAYGFLIFYLSGAAFLVFLAQGVPSYKADFAVKFVFYALLLSAIATILGYRRFGNMSAVGFFSENSHFALSFLPFLLYMVVLSGWRKKWFFLFMGFWVGLSLQSLTFLVGVIGIAMLTLRSRQMVVFSIVLISMLMVALDNIDIGYYSARVNLAADQLGQGKPSLSMLSYQSGWERIYLNLQDSYGIGIGFQQLGFLGTAGELLETLASIGAENLNRYDGSFVASKFISEFGILAVMVLVAYLVYFARNVRWLREVSRNGGETVDCRKVFFLACFVMFFADLFLRGTGYFSPTGFLFIASLMWVGLPPISRTPSRDNISDHRFEPHNSAQSLPILQK
jgi:hypothetical protein